MYSTSLSMLMGKKSGDESAWERFKDCFTGYIHRQLSRLISNTADLEEVAQEVMFVLIEKIKTFDRNREGSFRRFLREICYRKSLERIEKNRRHQQLNGVQNLSSIGLIEQLEDPDSELRRQWDVEHAVFVRETLLAEARKRCGELEVEIYCELQRQERSRNEIALFF